VTNRYNKQILSHPPYGAMFTFDRFVFTATEALRKRIWDNTLRPIERALYSSVTEYIRHANHITTGRVGPGDSK